MRSGPPRLTILLAIAASAALATTAVACSSPRPAPDAPGAQGTSVDAPVCGTVGAVTTVAYRSVDGVDPDLTSLDVHTPSGTCGAPVVVWVHGGGYQVGDKANAIEDKVALAGQHGWVLVSVNYRLTDPGSPTSAGYPDHFDDVAAAVAWVHEHIAELGGDPSRIALLGHSAGADIVSNVATDPTYLERAGLGLDALRCAGPLDTEGFDKVAAGASDPDGEKDQWQVALGNEPDYLERTSATHLIQPGIGIPPMIGVVRGTDQRQQIESAFLAALGSAGIAGTTIDARALSHEQVNRRIGAPGDTVMTPPLVAFLTGCFA